MLAKQRARDFEALRGSARGPRAVLERRALARAALFAGGSLGSCWAVARELLALQLSCGS